MKKLLLILAISISALVTNAQDGIARYIDTDTVDTFISVYNASRDVRVLLADTLYELVVATGEPRPGDYEFTLNNCRLYGEMFILKGSMYNLYDFYVDYVQHPDGSVYRATRFEKPKGPIDYSK